MGAREVERMHTAREQRSVIVRDSNERDVPAISRIYGHWVRHGLASFELEPPGEAEMGRRRRQLLTAGFPYLVAESDGGTVVGYACGSPYRSRAAYRFACEDSVYVTPESTRRGTGRALLAALIERCAGGGWRLMIAVIGDSANVPSISLHRTLGFEYAGLLPAVGWKQKRWVDTVLMVRPLGAGSAAPP
jgi:L-amino acid N-acyltransferase YncA